MNIKNRTAVYTHLLQARFHPHPEVGYVLLFALGVSNLWNGLWNGLMEWTDGMEYRLTKIAKTHYHGRGEVVSTVLPLLAQLDCYVQPLFSSLIPRPMHRMFCMWTMLCLAWITLSIVGNVDAR